MSSGKSKRLVGSEDANELYTHIAVVLDRSGSMTSMSSDVVNGFNKFVEDQKKEDGRATLSLAQFDDVYEVVHDFIDIKDMSGLVLTPRGSTALLDAMGHTLEETRAKVLMMKKTKQPSKVIFVFITDGEENASTKYTRKHIFSMIKDLKSPDRGDQINWECVFIGANQDAIAEGGSLGIRSTSSITFAATGAGATAAFTSLSKGVSTYRGMDSLKASYAFSDEDYDVQDKLLGKHGKRSKTAKGVIPTSIPDLDDGIVPIDEDKV